MTQHERQEHGRVVAEYELDTLGAPFKVTLLNCVSLRIDPKTGEDQINIPDLAGLIGAVVRARVSHPRKLNGKEIKFVRSALGIKAGQISKFLGMGPEHFSRCEGGTKVMATVSEKMFRLFAYFATYIRNPQELLIEILEGKANLENTKKYDEVAKKFVEQFLTIKIESAFDPDKELQFEFWRETVEPKQKKKTKNSLPKENEEWNNETKELAVA